MHTAWSCLWNSSDSRIQGTHRSCWPPGYCGGSGRSAHVDRLPFSTSKLAEHPIVQTGKDGKHLTLLAGVARISILLRCVIFEEWERMIHPLSRQLLAIEDLNGAGPDRFRTGMLHLHGLLCNGRRNYSLSSPHNLSLLRFFCHRASETSSQPTPLQPSQ